MGYTHYWTHKRRFSAEQWQDVKTAVARIIEAAELDGVKIGSFGGEAAVSLPSIEKDEGGEYLGFNGFGDDACETFMIYQNRKPLDPWRKSRDRGWDFCKTGRNEYDVAVTAVLVYLESVYPDQFSADSDGGPDDWQAGLALAEKALPQLDNVLRLPVEIVFDAQFSRHVMGGSGYSLLIRNDGAICICKGLHTLAVFPKGPAQDAAEMMMRRAVQKVPTSGEVGALDRARGRAIRKILDAAGMYGAELHA